MQHTALGLSLVFAAGSVGGLANALAMWAAGDYGITQTLGVAIAPALTLSLLYRRVVWGGLWGLLFLLPFPAQRWIFRAAIVSLGPTLVQLLLIFPYVSGDGTFGMRLGTLTPLVTALFNFVWALAASAWLRLSGR